MPEYLLTLHAYGTWLPDRPEGSYHWRRGYQSQDEHLARRYRENQRHPPVRFGESEQRVLIQSLLETAAYKRITLHAIATDHTHLHVLCEWDDSRTPAQVQDRIKHAITQRLNERIGRRSWFTRGGKPSRVLDVKHFDLLCDEYLPGHRGLRWDARRGWC